MGQIHTEYLNNAQINVLRNKIQNNITDSDALNNIIKEGNPLNDAMKNLGNSIGVGGFGPAYTRKFRRR